MRDAVIGNLMRGVRNLSPEDTIGKAAELLRVSGLAEYPMVSGGRLTGMVTEAAVLKALATGDSQTVIEEPVADIVNRNIVCVNPYMSIVQVAEVMNDHNLSVAAVVDEHGSYLGLAVRSDITGALSLTIRPPTVAGMATPLGVYLSTGHIRAGAGDFGLFLAGVALMAMYFAATGVIFGLAWLVDRTGAFHPSLFDIMRFETRYTANWMEVTRAIMYGLSLPVFLGLMRLAPISGYHAAEHMVVHAIENGEPLKRANVMAMPRVHPRCGTNIVAAVALFFLVRQVLSDDAAVMLFIFVLVFAWRAVGGYFQYYITTRPPSEKQLDNGIKAGESLLAQYRANPGYHVTGWRRLWNTGLPMVMLGSATAMGVAELIGRFFRL